MKPLRRASGRLRNETATDRLTARSVVLFLHIHGTGCRLADVALRWVSLATAVVGVPVPSPHGGPEDTRRRHDANPLLFADPDSDAFYPFIPGEGPNSGWILHSIPAVLSGGRVDVVGTAEGFGFGLKKDVSEQPISY